MVGHSISFASFHIVEVMSSPDFASKRIGYLAASQSFSPTTDVLLLTTNQFKKDLTNGKMQDCSQALTCLGKLVTEELGRDLENDVSLLLNSPRPYIRKKALLVLYRLIMVHPDTLPVVSSRFRERLADSDPGVVCAAVTVTCELARASPRSFLSLAPLFYQLLMNKESSNWMLIKIVKLMGVLTPLEPRLGKKLVEPLTALMRATRAKSLLYECCSTVTAGLMAHPEAVEVCAQRLAEFMDDADQNLKYLGLLSMRKLIQAHPHLAQEHRDNILDCLDDEDIGIRMRALELVSEFITSRTLRDISRILLRKLRKASADNFVGPESYGTGPGSDREGFPTSSYSSMNDYEAPYRDALAKQLLRAGEFQRPSGESKGGYEMLTTGDDFAWYTTTILGGLAEIPLLSTEVRDNVGDQLLELTSRVEALRNISIKVAYSLLAMRIDRRTKQTSILGTEETTTNVGPEAERVRIGEEEEDQQKVSAAADNTGERKSKDSSLQDAILSTSLVGNTAWILGEYADLIENHISATNVLVSFPKRNLDSSAHTRLLTACVKVFAASPESQAEKVHVLVLQYVDSLTDSQFAEVQERAWFFKSLLEEFESTDRELFAPMFEEKLIPVDHRAQARVPISEDLDLETPLLDTGSDTLYAYLSRTIGDTEDADDTGDDEEDFLKQQVISSHLQMQTGDMNLLPDASLLPNSSHPIDKAGNPYYLQQDVDSRVQRPSGSFYNEKRDEGTAFGYDNTSMALEAAVVIREDNPLGINVLDEERNAAIGKSSGLNEKLQAAFDGAFDSRRQPEQRRHGKRRKKKKVKDTAGRNTSVIEGGSDQALLADNLIDIGAESAEQTENLEDSSSRPKHLADILLI